MLRTSHRLCFKIIDVTIKMAILCVEDNYFSKSLIVNACTNSTYICLIPKKLSSLKLKDYRPISLVTSLYKILAKVLSLRLREVLFVRQ